MFARAIREGRVPLISVFIDAGPATPTDIHTARSSRVFVCVSSPRRPALPPGRQRSSRLGLRQKTNKSETQNCEDFNTSVRLASGGPGPPVDVVRDCF